MRIQKVRVEGFRLLQDVEIMLEPGSTVIVGRNNSGKTSLSDVFERFDMWLPRAHLECDFTYPARLDDRLRVAAYFTRFGKTSITINFDVAIAGTEHFGAVGHEVLVCTDRTTIRPRALPPELREILSPFAVTQAQARAYLTS